VPRKINPVLAYQRMNLKYLFFSLLITCSIVFLSSIPDQCLPGYGSLSERTLFNLGHIPAYALLTYLWLSSFTRTRTETYSFKITLIVIVGLVVFAISDEIHQSFVPGRTPSFMDFGLDLLGILIGLTFLRQLRIRRSRRV
jgi:VanZ family protein